MNDMSIILTISHAKPDDTGDYTCTATTQIGSVNRTISINVTAVDATDATPVVTALRNGCLGRFKGEMKKKSARFCMSTLFKMSCHKPGRKAFTPWL